MFRTKIKGSECIFAWDINEVLYLSEQIDTAFYKQLILLCGNDCLDWDQYQYHLKCMESFWRCFRLKREVEDV